VINVLSCGSPHLSAGSFRKLSLKRRKATIEGPWSSSACARVHLCVCVSEHACTCACVCVCVRARSYAHAHRVLNQEMVNRYTSYTSSGTQVALEMHATYFKLGIQQQFCTQTYADTRTSTQATQATQARSPPGTRPAPC